MCVPPPEKSPRTYLYFFATKRVGRRRQKQTKFRIQFKNYALWEDLGSLGHLPLLELSIVTCLHASVPSAMQAVWASGHPQVKPLRLLSTSCGPTKLS